MTKLQREVAAMLRKDKIEARQHLHELIDGKDESWGLDAAYSALTTIDLITKNLADIFSRNFKPRSIKTAFDREQFFNLSCRYIERDEAIVGVRFFGVGRAGRDEHDRQHHDRSTGRQQQPAAVEGADRQEAGADWKQRSSL